jgi:hypothetical protein
MGIPKPASGILGIIAVEALGLDLLSNAESDYFVMDI